MSKNIIEWADSIYNACHYKIDILKTSEDKFLIELGNSIEHFIVDRKSKIQDSYDLKAFRAAASNLLQLLGLLVQTSKPKANWLKPLLKECYNKIGVKSFDRKILVAQFPEKETQETYSGFIVYIDILKYSYFLPDEILKYKVDIFTLPSEVQFDIFSLPIYGHEVGHILWSELYESTIRSIAVKKFNKYKIGKGKKKIIDFKDYKLSKEEIVTIKHTQEHFCDEIGRNLFKIAFDLSLIRILSENQFDEEGDSHPPNDFRISKSEDNINDFIKINENIKFKKDIEDYVNNFLFIRRWKLKYTKSEIVIETVKEIFKTIPENNYFDISFYPKIENELNRFRPPIEVVRKKKLELNSPIKIVISTILYSINSKSVQSNNDFFVNSNHPEEEKQIILRSILKDHLIYSINLYDFAYKAQSKFKFNYKELEGSLWDMRERENDMKDNSLIIVPSIYPKSQYGENSIDLRLGSHFLLHRPSKCTHISPYPEEKFNFNNLYDEVYLSPNEVFILHPHQFVLASTLEYISLPFDYYALILGRSSWGRLGLNIATATVVQAGYRGCITLELRNLGEIPISIKVGVRIAQLCIITSPMQKINKGYYTQKNNKYIGPTKVQIPRIQEDIDWALLDY
jgi:dCTP deaminase